MSRGFEPGQMPVGPQAKQTAGSGDSMKRTSLHAYVVLGMAIVLYSGQAFGQITINEVVEDEQDFESTDITPDTREFVELYNGGASAVDISGWTIGTVQLATGLPFATDTLPGGSIIPAGGYFVMGQPSVPNVNYSPIPGELFPHLNFIFELRNPALTGSTLVDALAVDTFRGPVNHQELSAATQEQLDQIAAGQTVGNAPTGGWWGQLESDNAIPPNVPLSLGRYLNGRDTNRNGYDFGLQPLTPGASNNLPQVTAHSVPNVDTLGAGGTPLADGTALSSNYAASFVLPRVITPGTVTGYNPNAIPASPQGGKAIIAYDETGGGNAVVSKELVRKFDIYAFIDPRPLNVTTTDASPQSEAAIYGIGTTDPFFATPNSADLLTGNPGGNISSSANGSTGLGWLIQRRELFNGAAANRTTKTVLQLLDMNDGGDSVQETGFIDWQVKQTIDLTGLAEGWHRLSIEYDPTTGNVVARYDNQTFNFTSLTGMVGNFYVGWRENLPGANNSAARPPTYDLFVGGLPGDFNNDGKVDAGDYATWRKNAANASLPNDNGLTTQAARYSLWRSSFGTPGSGSGSLGVGAVPEPSTIGLAVIGMFSVLAGRRRRIG
jgi:hypothetical protein